jgi:transcriptional regulator of nitric oxide reductase
VIRARGAAAAVVLALAVPALGQEGVFLTEAEAPGAVFPDADRFERREVPVTPELRAKITAHLAGTTPSAWEDRYVVVRAFHADHLLGQAILVEEIGKHRPISFVVGLRPDGAVADVAVMTYREAYGGEIRSPRFLTQYRGKRPSDALRAGLEVINVAGATLSVEAAGRAVKKAQAVAAALAETGS